MVPGLFSKAWPLPLVALSCLHPLVAGAGVALDIDSEGE